MKEILKQSSWLIMAQVLTRIVGFFYTIFLARNLGVSDFGIYSVGLAYFSIISSFADFGFNRYLIREVAKEREKSWELICNVLMLRLALVSVFFAIFASGLYLLDGDKMRVSVILLASLSVLPQAIALTFDGIFIALQKLSFSALSAISLSFSTTFLGLFLINKGFGIYGAVNALILGQIIYAITLGFFLYKHQGFHVSKVTYGIIKRAVAGSLPYGILGMLGLLYFKIDTIILSYIRGNFETGIYSAAYKFLEALVFVPNALTFALFPIFAKLHEENPLKIKNLLYKSTKIMFISGLFITFAYFLFLPIIIKTFLPKFILSIEVIKILSLAIPFMFIHIPASSVLTSSEKYLKQVILFSLIPLVFNIILNLIFIPKFGLFAASWITVLSDVVSALTILLCIRKFVLVR